MQSNHEVGRTSCGIIHSPGNAHVKREELHSYDSTYVLLAERFSHYVSHLKPLGELRSRKMVPVKQGTVWLTQDFF